MGRLVPRLPVAVGATVGKAFLLLSDRPDGLLRVSVAAGQTKDLGDVVARFGE